ncbi:MAG: SAM-dependent methyltransferase, partial [Chlamydiae bacterium]|nr:SAM-dependent methyltransferase [Chlamydiota bacterium]
LLESPTTVGVSLLVGGIILMFIDKVFTISEIEKEKKISPINAFIIGLWQVLAMIPGVSRSAASIIGGMQQKLSRKLAAEFSFFLAVPTMCAATGYKLLKAFKTKKAAHLIPIAHIHRDVKKEEIDFFLAPLLKGEHFGLISDAGLPCLADPGYQVVRRAQEQGIEVRMVMGPTSLLMGLMLSGLPGQAFTFHGYLPKKPEELIAAIRAMPKNYTHIFIEAPFRNNKIMRILLSNLPSESRLCLAADLTLPTQQVMTKTVRDWQKIPLGDLEGRYCLFLLAH